ncbi:MAG: DnaJ C-terminal domain-containing protein [Myxococcota bacterium]|jgi:DnaJ-class molecular chaperone|nr:DnaJ C-terminal domain-containing protein [Myxococcota bacterium]
MASKTPPAPQQDDSNAVLPNNAEAAHCPYRLLGIDSTTSLDELKAAYRRRASELHPDRSHDDGRAFAELNEAYAFAKAQATTPLEVGGTGQKPNRQELGGTGQKPNQQEPASAAYALGRFAHRILEGRRKPLLLSLSIEQAVVGGAWPNQHKLRFELPGMHYEGERLNFGGQQYQVSIQAHPIFRRRGDELWLSVIISPFELLLGAELWIPTPEGKSRILLPPGSDSDTRLRLSGRGLPRAGGGRAELFVELIVEGAKTLSDETTSQLQAARDACAPNLFPRRQAFAQALSQRGKG